MRCLLAFTRVALVLLVSGLGGLKSAAADAPPGGAQPACHCAHRSAKERKASPM